MSMDENNEKNQDGISNFVEVDQTDTLGSEEITSDNNAHPDKSVRAIDAVYDVPVCVSAVLGIAKIPINELLKLTRGSIVELDRHVGDPVDILVNNRLIAKGEVVLLDDKIGITLTDVIKILK
jgi:flagellar motor switch protein FliN